MNVCASIPGANGDKSAKSLKGMQGGGDVGMVFRLTPLWGLRGHDWCLVSDPGLSFISALQCRGGQEPCVNEGTCVTYHNGTGYCR